MSLKKDLLLRLEVLEAYVWRRNVAIRSTVDGFEGRLAELEAWRAGFEAETPEPTDEEAFEFYGDPANREPQGPPRRRNEDVAKAERPVDLLTTTDAAEWARQFVALNPDMDEGTMISWFANAIETGRSAELAAGTPTIMEVNQATLDSMRGPGSVRCDHTWETGIAPGPPVVHSCRLEEGHSAGSIPRTLRHICGLHDNCWIEYHP